MGERGNGRRSNGSRPGAAARAEKKRRTRLRVMQVAFSLCLAYLAVRVGYLKYAYGDQYERKAILQQIHKQNSVEKIINPNRGNIYDRNKQSLAVSSTVFNVVLDIRILLTQDVAIQEKTLAALNEVLEIPMETLQGYLTNTATNPETGRAYNDTRYFIVARGISRKKATELQDRKVKCVDLENDTRRSYSHDGLAAQVLGFIRGDASWGLEKQYNGDLAGEPGRMFRVFDEDGSANTQQIPAQEGYSLVTTLDLTIQQFAEKAVETAGKTYEPENAAVIVMDINTGEILGMAQYPSFDINHPDDYNYFNSEPIKTQWEAISQEERLNDLYGMWKNFNISSTFEPGSIFKPMVVAAALEENVITPQGEAGTFYCGGALQVADRRIPCWNENGHGSQNVTQVLANSCNVGMMEIIAKLGRDKFFKYRNDFGYAQKTGVDLPGEADVSSPLVMYTLDQLNPVELATSSMGQGFNNTPIQAINALAAVANGGNLMRPYVVSQVVDHNGNVIKENHPEVVRKVISKETSDFMRTALQAVVSPKGTGKNAVIEGYSIGGKTGTGQQDRKVNGALTLSFIGYLPAENPEIIAMAIINRPNESMEGSTSAAPMLRDVLLNIIKYKNIRPTGQTSEKDNIALGSGNIAVENFLEMSTVDATRRLNYMHLDYEFIGNGDVVIRQQPDAGAQVAPDTKIFLTLSTAGEESGLAIVPNVSGLPEDQAVLVLTQAGLTPALFDPAAETLPASEETTATEGLPKTVGIQMPEPGKKVAKGTEVKLKLQ